MQAPAAASRSDAGPADERVRIGNPADQPVRACRRRGDGLGPARLDQLGTVAAADPVVAGAAGEADALEPAAATPRREIVVACSQVDDQVAHRCPHLADDVGEAVAVPRAAVADRERRAERSEKRTPTGRRRPSAGRARRRRAPTRPPPPAEGWSAWTKIVAYRLAPAAAGDEGRGTSAAVGAVFAADRVVAATAAEAVVAGAPSITLSRHCR